MRVRLTLVALLAPLASVAARQDPAVRRLGAPELRFAEPFSRIAGVAELPDGRLVVSDPLEGMVSLVDAASRRQIGRQGQGPAEYVRPFSVNWLSRDTMVVHDSPGRRLFLIDRQGTARGTLPLEMSLWDSGGISPARGIDALGRIYFQQGRRPAAGGRMPSTGRVIRWAPGSQRVETVAELLVRDPEGRRMLNAFVARDGWDVAPDGTLLIARAGDYHVEWVTPAGRVRAGPPVQVRRVPFTDDELDAWLRGEGRQIAAELRGRSSAGGAGELTAANLRRDWVFPAELPAFVPEAVLIAPGGEGWVVRSKAWDAPRHTVDIFDTAGRRTAVLELPPSRRLLGFGGRSVYLARVGEDGLEWVERYALPE